MEHLAELNELKQREKHFENQLKETRLLIKDRTRATIECMELRGQTEIFAGQVCASIKNMTRPVKLPLDEQEEKKREFMKNNGLGGNGREIIMGLKLCTRGESQFVPTLKIKHI